MPVSNRLELEKSLEFKSFQTLYELATTELENVKTLEEYELFRGAYSGFLLFNDKEGDRGVFYPFEKILYAYAVNESGKVKIGGEVKNLKVDASFWFGNSPNAMLKGGGLDHCIKTDGDRKVIADLFSAGTESIHLFTCSQKRNFLGIWNNYTTNHHFIPTFESRFEYLGASNSFIDNMFGWTSEELPIKLYNGVLYSANSVIKTNNYIPKRSSWYSFKVWNRGVGENDACTLSVSF